MTLLDPLPATSTLPSSLPVAAAPEPARGRAAHPALDAQTARSPLQAIADAVARHYKEQFGRGPQRCRAHFAGKDAVLVVLDGTMSPAERRLTDLGEGERVRSARCALQVAVQTDLVEAVAAVAGRPVLHGINGLEVHADVATELFVLAPEDGGAVSARG